MEIPKDSIIVKAEEYIELRKLRDQILFGNIITVRKTQYDKYMYFSHTEFKSELLEANDNLEKTIEELYRENINLRDRLSTSITSSEIKKMSMRDIRKLRREV